MRNQSILDLVFKPFPGVSTVEHSPYPDGETKSKAEKEKENFFEDLKLLLVPKDEFISGSTTQFYPILVPIQPNLYSVGYRIKEFFSQPRREIQDQEV